MKKAASVMAETRRRVLELHAQDLSYRKIGAKLGMSRTTVMKWIRASEEARDPPKPIASIPERKFAANVVKGMEPRAAARKAGVRADDVDDFLDDVKENKRVATYIAQAIEGTPGTSREDAVNVVRDAMKADKSTMAGGMIPDWSARLKAAGILMDHYKEVDAERERASRKNDADRHQIVIMSKEEAALFQVFTGGELPDNMRVLEAAGEEVIDVPSEEQDPEPEHPFGEEE